MTFYVREATLADIDGVVDVHQNAFKGYFLTLLGPWFLELLYSSYLMGRDAALFVVVRAADETVVGLLAGARDPSRFFRKLLLRRGARFALAALSALVRQPVRVGERLLSALRYRGDMPNALSGYWLLSSLGIDPQYRGNGLGGRIVDQFAVMANRAGALGIYLVTDELDNPEVIRFYKAHDFAVHSTFERRDHRRLVVLARSFAK